MPGPFPYFNGHPRKRAGIALLLVLLLVSLLSIVVYTFAGSTRVNLRLARNRAAELQIVYLGKAGIEATKTVLGNDARNSRHDWLGEDWAKPFPPIATEGATITVRIIDEERKINLNGLLQSKARATDSQKEIGASRATVRARIKRAIELLDTTLDASRFIDQLESRLDRGIENSEDSDESSPFAGTPLHSIDELLRLDDVDAQVLYGKGEGKEHEPGLADILTVTSTGLVNVNTAPAEVLEALHEDVSSGLAENILHKRKDMEGFEDIETLSEVPGMEKEILAALRPLLTTESRVFTATVSIEKGQLRRKIRAVIQRSLNSASGRIMPNLVFDQPRMVVLRWEDYR